MTVVARCVAMLTFLLLAGCAAPQQTPGPSPGVTTTPTSIVAVSTSPTPAPSPTAATPSPSPEVRLGVVFDETYDYSAHGGNETIRLITVGPGVTSIRFDITSGGPPADGSFQSAVVDFFFPRSTSPFLAELPGQQAHSFNFTRYVDASSPGDWKIRFAGQGKTTVHVVVTLQ